MSIKKALSKGKEQMMIFLAGVQKESNIMLQMQSAAGRGRNCVAKINTPPSSKLQAKQCPKILSPVCAITLLLLSSSEVFLICERGIAIGHDLRLISGLLLGEGDEEPWRRKGVRTMKNTY